MKVTDLELLQTSPLFRALSPELVAKITRGAFVQTLPKGAVLFSEGEDAEFLHVILSGRVALTGHTTDDVETVIEFFNAGDVFVAPAVMLRQPYLLSARISVDARVLMLPGEKLREHLARECAFAEAMALTLARYWRLLVTQIKDLKLRSAPQRLAAYLLDQTNGHKGPAKFRLVEERRMLAARLGMTPESLSRAFAQLRDFGVGGGGYDVVIDDPAALRRFCGERGVN